MHPEQPIPEKHILARNRRLLFVFFATVSMIYIWFGYKNSTYSYEILRVVGCIFANLLLLSYAPRFVLSEFFKKEKAEQSSDYWRFGMIAISLIYFFLMPVFLQFRKNIELNLGETQFARARVISSGKYRTKRPYFDYYVIEYTTPAGKIIQNLDKKDAFFWGYEIPIRYSVSNHDLFEIVR